MGVWYQLDGTELRAFVGEQCQESRDHLLSRIQQRGDLQYGDQETTIPAATHQYHHFIHPVS